LISSESKVFPKICMSRMFLESVICGISDTSCLSDLSTLPFARITYPLLWNTLG
jgi:hypothetical protein